MKKNSMLKIKLIGVLCLMTTLVIAQDLHTESNAVSMTNESNTTTGWGSTSGLDFVSQGTEVYQGSYAFKIETTSDGWRRAYYDIDLNVGDQYEIIIYAKKSGSPKAEFAAWDGFSDFSFQAITENWQEHKFTLTASSATGRIKVYPGLPAVVGNTVYIDRVSITNLSNGTNDSNAPSVPANLSSTAQGETTIDLSWSASNDDTAVTGYKVFQGGSTIATLGNVTNYQVTGLNADTNYTFSVSAFDAAGNESAASAAITVGTASGASGGGGSGSSGGWTVGSGIVHYNDQVAVGTQSVPNQYLMAVDGKLITEEVRVELSDSNGNWPDYVFTDAHELPTLAELKKHIDSKGHLPKIPSAQEVATHGIELGEMNRLLLEKIEELTLYLIQQEARIQELEKNQR